jgi:hypothetical protein
VLDWQPVGDRIRVAVNNNGATSKVLRSLEHQFKANHMQISILRQTRKTMEDTFVYLVNSQGEA